MNKKNLWGKIKDITAERTSRLICEVKYKESIDNKKYRDFFKQKEREKAKIKKGQRTKKKKRPVRGARKVAKKNSNKCGKKNINRRPESRIGEAKRKNPWKNTTNNLARNQKKTEKEKGTNRKTSRRRRRRGSIRGWRRRKIKRRAILPTPWAPKMNHQSNPPTMMINRWLQRKSPCLRTMESQANLRKTGKNPWIWRIKVL